MITSTVAVLFLALGAQSGHPAGAPEPQREGTCIVCHGTERVLLERGVHATAGLTCVSCHGGDPTAIEAAAAHALDFHALSDPLASVASCGDCHSDVQRMGASGLRTDQLELYRLSPHGAVLFETGNPDVATCSACHGTHEIRHAQDPTSSVHPLNQPATCGACHSDAERMEPYGLPTDAVELYTRSVHGRAVADGLLSSPACSDCHGHHGALPPRVENAELVCGLCHSVVREQ